MIILTIKEHTFKSEEPFGIASKFLEESDFNDLDIESNYQLPIVETYPDNWIFENDLTVRFYKVISKGDEETEPTNEEIQDILLVDALLEDLDIDAPYWSDCFKDLPVGQHTLDLSFDPPTGEDSVIQFNGSTLFKGK